MMVNTDNLISITEANRNFSQVARMVDKNGSVVILKNNEKINLGSHLNNTAIPQHIKIFFCHLAVQNRFHRLAI